MGAVGRWSRPHGLIGGGCPRPGRVDWFGSIGFVWFDWLDGFGLNFLYFILFCILVPSLFSLVSSCLVSSACLIYFDSTALSRVVCCLRHIAHLPFEKETRYIYIKMFLGAYICK